MVDLPGERARALRRVEHALPEREAPAEDRVSGSRPRVDPHDEILPEVSRGERVRDRRSQRPTVGPFGHRQDPGMVDPAELALGRQHDRDRLGDPVPWKQAQGRKASLSQEPRELMVQPRVPGDDRDRPVSHRQPDGALAN